MTERDTETTQTEPQIRERFALLGPSGVPVDDVFEFTDAIDPSHVRIGIDAYERHVALRTVCRFFLAALRMGKRRRGDDHGDEFVRTVAALRLFGANGVLDEGQVRVLDAMEGLDPSLPAALGPLRDFCGAILATPIPVDPSGYQRMIDWVADTFEADETSRLLLEYLARASRSAEHMAALAVLEKNEPYVSGWQTPPAGAGVLQTVDAQAMFADDGRNLFPYLFRGPLFSSGIMRLVVRPNGTTALALSDVAKRLLGSGATSVEEIVPIVFPQPLETVLTLADFSHLGEGPDRIASIVQALSKDPVPGAGILLDGPTGTGKTAFAMALARHCGLHPVFAGRQSEGGSEPSRSDRLSDVLFLTSLASKVRTILPIVDEADDVLMDERLEERVGRQVSKGYLNDALDRSTAPTIWIVNQIKFGESFMRRMQYRLDFTVLGDEQRRRIARSIAGRVGADVDPRTIDRIAALRIPPATVENGLRLAKLTGDGEIGLASMRSIGELIGGYRRERRPSKPFDPSLVEANRDVVHLADRIVASPVRDVSILIEGISGAGKSAFCRYLADRMGLEFMSAKASDVLGGIVGETEKRIAALFREAERSSAFLIIDEIDSLLSDRRNARQSWEVTMVNEMLTWIEDHPFPIAGTTNLVDRIDPAFRRRFDFKIRFEPLSRERIALAWTRFFEGEAPESVLRLHPLAPGDFEAVRRRMRLEVSVDASWIARELTEEVEGKEDAGNRIGF